MPIYDQSWSHICMHTGTQAHRQIHKHTHTYTCTRTHTHTHTQTHTHTHTDTHTPQTHTHTHTHTVFSYPAQIHITNTRYSGRSDGDGWKFSKVGLLLNPLFQIAIELTFEKFYRWRQHLRRPQQNFSEIGFLATLYSKLSRELTLIILRNLISAAASAVASVKFLESTQHTYFVYQIE